MHGKDRIWTPASILYITNNIEIYIYTIIKKKKKGIKMIQLNLYFGFRAIHVLHQSNVRSYTNCRMANDAFIILIT